MGWEAGSWAGTAAGWTGYGCISCTRRSGTSIGAHLPPHLHSASPTQLPSCPPLPPPAVQEFPRLSDAGLDLLNRLLTFDPEKRITARAALRHLYFSERPLPRLPEYMPSFPSAHDAADGKGDRGGYGGGGGGGGGKGEHQRQRREMEEAHGRGVKRRYQQEGQEGDRFGDAFGDARAHRRPEMLRRLD